MVNLTDPGLSFFLETHKWKSWNSCELPETKNTFFGLKAKENELLMTIPSGFENLTYRARTDKPRMKSLKIINDNRKNGVYFRLHGVAPLENKKLIYY